MPETSLLPEAIFNKKSKLKNLGITYNKMDLKIWKLPRKHRVWMNVIEKCPNAENSLEVFLKTKRFGIERDFKFAKVKGLQMRNEGLL